MSKLIRNVPWLTQEKMSPRLLVVCFARRRSGLQAARGRREAGAKRRPTGVPGQPVALLDRVLFPLAKIACPCPCRSFARDDELRVLLELWGRFSPLLIWALVSVVPTVRSRAASGHRIRVERFRPAARAQ